MDSLRVLQSHGILKDATSPILTNSQKRELIDSYKNLQKSQKANMENDDLEELVKQLEKMKIEEPEEYEKIPQVYLDMVREYLIEEELKRELAKLEVNNN